MADDGDIDYERLRELAAELGRPVSTLIALASQNDPFYAGMPSRRRDGGWFGELWERFELAKRTQHLRRIHYYLVSQPTGSVLMPNGDVLTPSVPYTNTLEHWTALCEA